MSRRRLLTWNCRFSILMREGRCMNEPMSSNAPKPPWPTQFRGKTWISVAVAVVIGGLSAFCLVMGPPFLAGAVKAADGKPATGAGIALCIIGTLLAPVAALAVFRVVALRRPLVRLCREGIVVTLVGVSAFDELPYIPGLRRAFALARLAWLIVSGQGFKRQFVYAPWECFQVAEVSGPMMARRLTIMATFFLPADRGAPPEYYSDQIVFEEVAFAARLERVAQSLSGYAGDAQVRQLLPSWTG